MFAGVGHAPGDGPQEAVFGDFLEQVGVHDFLQTDDGIIGFGVVLVRQPGNVGAGVGVQCLVKGHVEQMFAGEVQREAGLSGNGGNEQRSRKDLFPHACGMGVGGRYGGRELVQDGNRCAIFCLQSIQVEDRGGGEQVRCQGHGAAVGVAGVQSAENQQIFWILLVQRGADG